MSRSASVFRGRGSQIGEYRYRIFLRTIEDGPMSRAGSFATFSEAHDRFLELRNKGTYAYVAIWRVGRGNRLIDTVLVHYPDE